MHFPVVFHIFGLSIHSHALFEVLGYTIGFQTFLLLRRRRRDESVPAEPLLWIFAGCVMGALFFSKLLAWAESWPQYWEHRNDPAVWLGGKTIVGGLIGGWVGVEITKKILGIRLRTGDAYIIPLCLGIAIGRIGCFLTGLADHTHGIATSLPWAVDFGDGIPRHPAQLYEIVYLLILACAFATKGIGWKRDTAGDGFRWFMLAYMLFRFAIEFIKPSWKGYAGLSAIQWAALMTAGVAAVQLARRRPAPALAEGV